MAGYDDFEFNSPGVQIREVDKSEIGTVGDDKGLVIIGRARRGPGMAPIRVRSKGALLNIFGNPIPNRVSGGDIWRSGNTNGSTYGLYAAQAWLEQQGSPVTFIRLLGNDAASNDRDATYTAAGWNLGGAELNISTAHNCGAYGLFMMPSGAANSNVTGTLAAIFYMTGAAVALNGRKLSAPAGTTSSAGTFIQSDATTAHKFTLDIYTSGIDTPSSTKTITLTSPGASNGSFIRTQMNTNPQKLYSTNFTTSDTIFLGETFEEAYKRRVSDINAAVGGQFGIILALENDSASNNFVNHLGEAAAAKTGWVFSRNPSPIADKSKPLEEMTKLFRIHALHESESFGKNYYIQIKVQSMGSSNAPSKFAVIVRRNSDSSIIEQFSNLTLKADHPDYIGFKIGDKTTSWDTTNKVFTQSGVYDNKSSYIRVEIAPALQEDADNNLLVPWGFYGPARPKGFVIIGGATEPNHVVYPEGTTFSGSAAATDVFVKSNAAIAQFGGSATQFVANPLHQLTASFEFPRLKLTEENTKNSGNYTKNDPMGVRHAFSDSGNDIAGKIYDDNQNGANDYKDLVAFTAAYDKHSTPSDNSKLQYSFIFSLDDVRKKSGTTTLFYWESGSAQGGHSYTAMSGSDTNNSSNPGYFQAAPLAFNVPLIGGFDGVDITQVNPFSSKNVLNSHTTLGGHYAYNSVDKAIDFLSKDAMVDADVIAMPGITNVTLNKKLLDTVNARQDALAIIDYDDDYLETWENNGLRDSTNGTVSQVLADAVGANYNSSYAAAYFPRVKISDGTEFVAPASLGGIGALISSDSNSQGPWFAPAGFNRGGLNDSIGVVNTFKTLTKQNRDDLYTKHINPIANFAAIGTGTVVAFGQKTLLVNNETSALSRINVRRLLIFLKNRISAIADTILFEPAVDTTFNNFSTATARVLEDVKSRFGITEYKIVLDESQTADAIDQNIMYAQVYIKPARAIEFIAIDFIISKTSEVF